MNEQHNRPSERMERAILVGVIPKKEANDLEHHSLRELRRLADTAGVDVLETVIQYRDQVNPAWYIGKGKVEQIREAILSLEPDTVIFNQELSGMQVRNLENVLQTKIIDRTQLILDIFASRARTREGKLQVELAQLQYLLPRLSGHGRNLSRLGGGIGTRGPGETRLETDRRHIRGRIRELKRKIQDVARHRNLHRERRKKSDLYQVVLVGYTNAGKSTLLRQLTGADTFVEDRLFATLDPSSRLARLPSGKNILVSDTVGFIRDLPHDLVDAFRSTLEEVLSADLILIVVDGSSPFFMDELRVVHKVLEDLGAGDAERLTVFNKMDLCPPEQRNLLAAEGDVLHISAWNREDIGRLKQKVRDMLPDLTMHLSVPAADGRLLSLVHRCGEIVEQHTDGDIIALKVRMDRRDYEKNRRWFDPYIHRKTESDGR